MTPTEALELALDALTESIDLVRNDYATDWRHGLPTRKAQLDGMAETVKAHEAAIEACRAALAAPSVPSGEPVAWRITQGARVFFVSAAEFTRSSYDYGEFAPLYAAPQPAPAGWRLVAWQWLDTGHLRKKIPKNANPENWRPLYAAPAAPGGAQ